MQDLLNFEDPLNVDAAEHYERDKVSHFDFQENVKSRHEVRLLNYYRHIKEDN